MGYSGIHYDVMNALRKYGKFANGREDAVRVLRQLLKEYELSTDLKSQQSDEDYLSKFDEDLE